MFLFVWIFQGISEPVQVWYWPKKKKIEEEGEEEEEEEEDSEDVSENFLLSILNIARMFLIHKSVGSVAGLMSYSLVQNYMILLFFCTFYYIYFYIIFLKEISDLKVLKILNGIMTLLEDFPTGFFFCGFV